MTYFLLSPNIHLMRSNQKAKTCKSKEEALSKDKFAESKTDVNAPRGWRNHLQDLHMSTYSIWCDNNGQSWQPGL